jgi:hypothetical protein
MIPQAQPAYGCKDEQLTWLRPFECNKPLRLAWTSSRGCTRAHSCLLSLYLLATCLQVGMKDFQQCPQQQLQVCRHVGFMPHIACALQPVLLCWPEMQQCLGGSSSRAGGGGLGGYGDMCRMCFHTCQVLCSLEIHAR